MKKALVLLALAAAPTWTYAESYTHRLSQSGGGLTLWTTPPTERVFKDDAVPAAVDGEVRVYAARNETEPFQLVVRPTSTGPVSVSMGAFGSGITTELYQVRYVPIAVASDNLGRTGEYPDPLWPLPLPTTVDLTANVNTSLWFSVTVPPGAPYGDYVTTVQVGAVAVPVKLHVFAFAVPDALHVRSELSVSYPDMITKYNGEMFSFVNLVNQFFIDRRLTPVNFTYPGALAQPSGAPVISYDCAGALTDNDGTFGFEVPATKYLDGIGFNYGTGFPSFPAVRSATGNGSTDPRPASFCGIPRTATDWVSGNNPNSPYNLKWRQYVTGLRNYLDGLGYLDRGYVYVGGEPTTQAGYDGAAWYAQLLKGAAPDLSLAIAAAPRPEIYAHPLYTGAKIDQWLSIFNDFDPAISGDRLQFHGEATWLYFLRAARTPRFNPITLDHPGIEAKLAGWFAWKYRIGGYQNYAVTDWSQNPWTTPNTTGHNGQTFLLYPPSLTNTSIPAGSNGNRLVPSIRLELLRDGLEDYEYLYVMNGGPSTPGLQEDADLLASRMVNGVTAYTRDSAYAYELRRQIGLYLGGEMGTFPDALPPSSHARAQGFPGNYYINFQDPAGQPLANPLVVNGNTYLKVGWNLYSQALGYGWYGDLSQAFYSYLASAPNELQRSVIYDDFGRIKTFEFDLPNGLYSVTLSMGRTGRTDLHQKAVIEGVPFVSDETSVSSIVRTFPVLVQDHRLTLELGKDGEYNFLNYMDIVTLDADGDGLSNTYEAAHACLDPAVPDSGLDPDQDLLTTTQESAGGTDPCNGDSDGGGDNDGSERRHNRNPMNASDDATLTLTMGRPPVGAKVFLGWDDTLGANGQIDGPYFVYRGSNLPLTTTDLLQQWPDGYTGSSDPTPSCSPCFYQVRNTRLP